MKVETIKLNNIHQKDFEIVNESNPKNNWEVKITATADDSGNDSFIEYIQVQIIRRTTTKSAKISVVNVFEIVSKDKSLVPMTDFDYWLYADLVQISLSHTRVLFHERLQDTELKNDYLRIDPIQKAYTDLKNGYLKLWN